MGNDINNEYDGISLDYSNDNIISGNKISNSSMNGISLMYCSGNIVSRNNVTNSDNCGIGLSWCSGNKIFHNSFVNNYYPAYAWDGNEWDDGYPSGGNYWSNYNGIDAKKGPNQNQLGSDGIGDTAYAIDASNIDRYPLMKPYGGPFDIGITHITTSKTVVGQGYNLNVYVKIINYGINTETFNITAYANSTIIATLTDITLTSRNSTTITFPWGTTGYAMGIYTISANISVVEGETDTTDNTYIDGIVKIATPGDINGDGHVNLSDLSLLADHWFSIPHYDPRADINSDGFINLSDLSILADYWFKGPLD